MARNVETKTGPRKSGATAAATVTGENAGDAQAVTGAFQATPSGEVLGSLGGDTVALLASTEAAPELGVERESAAIPDDVVAIVFCLVRGGCRRGGRRWEFGRTQLRAVEVTDALLAALDADPEFTVALRPED